VAVDIPDEVRESERECVTNATPSAPRVRVRPWAPVFESGENVVLDVVLDNMVPAGRSILIDHALTAVSSDGRPETRLDFEITREDGTAVQKAPRLEFDRTHFRPRDLMILAGGSFHGWRVAVDQHQWAHELPPGKYRLCARVENRIQGYFDAHPKERKTYLAAAGIPEMIAANLLRDFTADSEFVSFEVRGPLPRDADHPAPPPASGDR
jgi:hypothetical protein